MGSCNSSPSDQVGNIALFGPLAFVKPAACDKSPRALIQATNNIVAVAISQSISNCFAFQTAQQEVRVRCRPILPTGEEVYEANPACGQCIQNVLLDFQQQDSLERAAWNPPQSATVRQPIDKYYATLKSNIETCGLTYCKACVLSNITQMNIVSATDECVTTFMTQANIQNNISTLVQQQLLNNQDVLAGVAQTLGSNEMTTLTDKISQNIVSVTNSEFLQDLRTTLEASQIIELVTSDSVTLANISQASAITVTQSFVDANNVAINAFGEETFTAIANIVNQQTTINDVGEAVFKATLSFANAVDSSVGIVMLAMIALLGVTLLGILGYAAYREIRDLSIKRAQREYGKAG